MKKIWCAFAAFALIVSMASCTGGELPTADSSIVAGSAATSQPAGPNKALSASLTRLLAGHSSEAWYHHIEKAQVFQRDGISQAEIVLKAASTQYSSAAVVLSELFSAEQLDAFFPGLCGAAEELGISEADVTELGKLFYQLLTQDDAQNYYKIEQYGLPAFQLLANITGEKVSKIKADIDSRIVDDAKVAKALFQALNETYAKESGEITQSEMTRIASTILMEFQDASIGKVIFADKNGTMLKEVG